MDAKAQTSDLSEQTTLSASDIWKISRLEALLRQSRLFSWQGGRIPEQLPLPVIPDLWRGDAKIGAAILQNMAPSHQTPSALPDSTGCATCVIMAGQMPALPHAT